MVRNRVSLTFLDNILTLNSVALISILIVCYDIYFARLIQVEFHMREFSKTITFLFPVRVQQLCDEPRVLPIPDIYHWIELMHMVDISFIKDLIKQILSYIIFPPSTSGMIYTEELSILVEPIE